MESDSCIALSEDVERRLSHGGNFMLYGPRGVGKTIFLLDLQSRMLAEGIPCALAHNTSSLDDITCALEKAYPLVDTERIGRRAARARLWNAADSKRGVLLLDHLTELTNPMVGFLRRLRGGVVGVLTAVDVEVERERQRLRPWRSGALSIRMPPAPAHLLRTMLRERLLQSGLPRLQDVIERQLLRRARGRPGWILECVRLQAQDRYWRGGRLAVALLCTDTEISLRQGNLQLISPEAGG